jgi:hypothetical protein
MNDALIRLLLILIAATTAVTGLAQLVAPAWASPPDRLPGSSTGGRRPHSSSSSCSRRSSSLPLSCI